KVRSTAAAAVRAVATIRQDAAPEAADQEAADPAVVDRAAPTSRIRSLLRCTITNVGASDYNTRSATASRPIVAITMGDPAGIGPDVAARAAADPRVLAVCEPCLYGPPSDASFEPGILSAAAGRAAYDTIVTAVEAAQQGRVNAIATAPVNKEA